MKIIHFYHFDSDPRFLPFLLYVRWKSGVTFVRRCFRDVLVIRCNNILVLLLQTLANNAIYGIAIGVGLAFPILVIATGNIITGFLATLSMVSSTVCVIGVVTLGGWKLGVSFDGNLGKVSCFEAYSKFTSSCFLKNKQQQQ